MNDRFHPVSMEQLTDWVFTELDRRGSIFNVPRSAFFVPRPDHRFRRHEYGVELETPFGVAAGPHTQMAQNIVAAWLVGARLIELKTIQTLDELNVHKPCIDVTDEGYNVEWSQELKVHQSFDEYLRAWVLIHALHRALGWPGERPGMLFNMSVGYNLEGIHRPNVQWYLDAMADASAYLPAYVEIVARRCPAIHEVDIPARISSTVTLSTMHGCPPDEIERISRYLIDERGLHTSVKCNPTLLGPERVRGIVNDTLGYVDVPIPDAAFGHDLTYADAVPMFRALRQAAAARDVTFGLKLSNTLEVENWRGVFRDDPTTYMSGRALHAVTTNLSATLASEFGGTLPLSFAGGADYFNVADLLGAGMRTVTVCSDLLKTGGYLRMLQYPEQVDVAFNAVGAGDIPDFARRTARNHGFAGDGGDTVACELSTSGRTPTGCGATGGTRSSPSGPTGQRPPRAGIVRLHRGTLSRRVPDRPAGAPLHGRGARRRLPRGRPHHAPGQPAARGPRSRVRPSVREHLHPDPPRPAARDPADQALHHGAGGAAGIPREPRDGGTAGGATTQARVAIVGAGPAGLAAAEWLARDGIGVTIFEEHPYPGGMVGGAIPSYRLPQAAIDQDLGALERRGVEIRYGQTAGVDFTLDDLRRDGFAATFIAVGAQRAKRLGLPGEDATGVIDGVDFLRSVREGRPVAIGTRVGVVGAGDTAMDCVRSARRVGAASVALIYRRTIDQMPADPEEIHAIREEGIEIVELARPVGLHVEDGMLAGLVCTRTAYRGARDAAGRKVPHDVAGSEFEIGLDTLILAISQHPVLELFGDRAPDLTPAGFVAVDPQTFETSIPGVYAGGDVAAHGPASIVKAAADGKRVATAIAAWLGLPVAPSSVASGSPDLQALTIRRARREYRVPIRVSLLDRREDFEETVLGYSAEEATREAGRCLDCDQICSLCVGVCPNMALMTYEMTPVRAALPVLGLAEGAVVSTGTTAFVVAQRLQIAVLTDFCNKCGTCVTACPTSGRPFVDKPRLYLDRADFEAQASNAFMLLGGGMMEGRFDGATHRIAISGAGRATVGSPTRQADSGRSSTATHSRSSRRRSPALRARTSCRSSPRP